MLIDIDQQPISILDIRRGPLVCSSSNKDQERGGNMQQTRSRRLGAKLGISIVVISAVSTGACSAQGTTAERSAGSTQTTTQVKVDVAKELRKLETGYKGRLGAFAIDTGTGKT